MPIVDTSVTTTKKILVGELFTLTGASPQITLGKLNTTSGGIKFFGSTSGNVTLAPNVAAGASVTVTLPATSVTLNAAGDLTGLGTGVATALAVNVGSAGAFLTFNGDAGTPSALVGTNITGTAAGLTAGNVTTNANLTGHVTSVGNAAVLGSFTFAQLNTAVSDADVAQLGANTFTGAQTLTAASPQLTLGVLNTTSGGIKFFGSTSGNVTLAPNVAAGASVTVTLPATSVTLNAAGDLTGLGTGVATALAVNVGSAGAFLTFNGDAGTPSALVGTNITGTAAGLTAGNVTTNANLTGHVTSVGNAAVLGSFTLAELNAAVSDGTVGSGGLLDTINFTAQTVALASISNGSPAVFTTTAVRLPENGSPIQLTTSGTLPTGLSLATTYWVINASGTTFNVSATKGGAAINTSSAGSGTHTMNSIYVKNASSSFVVVEVQGAGGGGGGAANNGAAAGGGGAGGYSRKKILLATLDATETITIGAGGAAGSGGATGGTGATSSFGAHASATGGLGGTGAATAVLVTGGVGGAGASGDINLTGDPGGASVSGATDAAAMSGKGGSSTLGGAGKANAGAVANGVAATNNSGSGGGGAIAVDAGGQIGSLGGSGRVIVYEYL